METNLAAVAVAAVAAFVVGGAYYAVLGARLATYGSAAALRERPSPWLVPVELLRAAAVAAVVGALAAELPTEGVGDALALAAALWLAFPAVLLAGSVFHERVDPRLAALHAGDWFAKLVVISLVVTLWR